jgi:hypothetical protein
MLKVQLSALSCCVMNFNGDLDRPSSMILMAVSVNPRRQIIDRLMTGSS